MVVGGSGIGLIDARTPTPEADYCRSRQRWEARRSRAGPWPDVLGTSPVPPDGCRSCCAAEILRRVPQAVIFRVALPASLLEMDVNYVVARRTERRLPALNPVGPVCL